MTRIFALAVAAATAVAAPALAGPGNGDRMIERMDLNGDGAVSAAEAGALRAVRFLSMDANGDGVVTEAEMVERIRARIEARVAKRFARLDRNGDGRIDRDEFELIGAERFARLDADGDGVASGDELRAAMQHRRHGHHRGDWWGDRDDRAPAE